MPWSYESLGYGRGDNLSEARIYFGVALCSSEVAQLDVSKLLLLEESSFLPSVPIAERLNFEPSGKCRKCFNCRKHCFNLNFIDICV